MKKEQVNDMQLEFEASDNKENKVNGIGDSAIYAKKLTIGQLLGLYYLISWKSYQEEKDTWEPASTIQHLRKLVTIYYKNNPVKSIAISLSIDRTSPMARSTRVSTK